MGTVLERVRAELAAQRAAGADFADAWPAALGAALSSAEREQWQAALEETRPGWHAAYQGGPARRPERALAAVGTDPEHEREPTGLPDPWDHNGREGRACVRCGGPVAPDKHPAARYCSYVCQRAAHGRRVVSVG